MPNDFRWRLTNGTLYYCHLKTMVSYSGGKKNVPTVNGSKSKTVPLERITSYK